MKMKVAADVMIGLGVLFLLSGSCPAAEKADTVELRTETERINYSVGYQVGGDFAAQGVELNPELMVQGIRDALKKNKPLLSQEQMKATLVSLKKKVVADQQPPATQTAAENRKAAAAFLAENARQKGVVVLPGGVQYKVLKEGSGSKPTLKDDVRVHYRITRADGREVGSTYIGGKPRTFPITKAYPALQEVLLMMPEGSRWQIVLPTGTGPGDRETLENMGVVIYEMELLGVSRAK